jgi:hypothetical protein
MERYQVCELHDNGGTVLNQAPDIGGLSDGYHTFDELYEHRIMLYITLCKSLMAAYVQDSLTPFADPDRIPVWKSKVHSDGSTWDGWFIMGIDQEPGLQITYHLPVSKWDLCGFAFELEKAPEFDGHTPADVLKRLESLCS